MLKTKTLIFRLTITVLLQLPTAQLFAQPDSFDRVKISRDGIIINGMLFPVDGEASCPAVLLLQGFPGGESDIFGIGAKLQEAGILTLTFNYSGTFGSEGEYSMEHTFGDIDAALDFLKSDESINKYNIDTANIYLGGYSYGGGMAFSYAANHINLHAIFSIAGTDHGQFFRDYFRDKDFAKMIDTMFEQLKVPEGPVSFVDGKMPRDITPQYLALADSSIDLRKIAPLIADRKILMIAGIDDPMVTMENHMLPLYRTLQNEDAENVKFVLFQDDHSFGNTRRNIAVTILNWINID